MSTDPQVKSVKRWLLVSLVFNLFLVCGVVGGAWRWWVAEHTAPVATAGTAQPRGLRFAADELSAEQRKAFRLALREARREADASIQAGREGRRELMGLVGAAQFDHTAAAAALARIREADTTVRARLETSVIDFAATLSPADRQKLADGLARRSGLSPPAPAQPAKPKS